MRHNAKDDPLLEVYALKQTNVRWAQMLMAGALVGSAYLAQGAPIPGLGSWEMTLQARDLDGNLATAEAYFDTDLNITWLADANYARSTGYDSDGRMNWAVATAWAAGLNPYGSGITGWRLGTMPDTSPAACNVVEGGPDCGSSGDTSMGEMAHLSELNLGNHAIRTASGNLQPNETVINTGPFVNFRFGRYWMATEFEADTGLAWLFRFRDGKQRYVSESFERRAWAVHDGDVGAAVLAVPIPAAIWLFGSALIALGIIGPRKGKYAA